MTQQQILNGKFVMNDIDNKNYNKNNSDDGDDNDDWTPRLFLAWRVLALRPPFP